MTKMKRRDVYKQGVLDGVEFALKHKVVHGVVDGDASLMIMPTTFPYLLPVTSPCAAIKELYERNAQKELLENRKWPFPWKIPKGV